MKTNLKPENRSWPRENAKNTKTDGLNPKGKRRPDFFILCAPPRTTSKRDLEQEATERTEIRTAKSLDPVAMEICRSIIRVMSSFKSALCSLCWLLFKPVWLRSSLCALCVLLWQNALADVHYVDVNSTNATLPYVSWATAATNIQDAVDAAVAGDEIVVTNGIYATGGRDYNRVAVDKPLSLRSVNGPQSITIVGGDAGRCVYLTNAASLSGFTLTGGTSESGAGVFCESTNAVLSNCVVSGNSSRSYSSGGFPAVGGGAIGGTLNNCILTGNTAYAQFSQHNTGRYHAWGGGAAYCVLNNCTLIGNSAFGANFSQGLGGGTYHSTLNNCTLIDNSAGSSGGGASACTMNNCIIYFNYGDNYDPYSTLNYSCTSPQPTNGVGNITNAPLFVDQSTGNLRLQSNSPCINAGLNAFAPAGLDLDGNPRISGGTVDIGAYEFVFTPQMNLGRLILLVEAADLGAKHQQPLLATLNAALASLTRGNATAANHQLLAFQNQLRAQVAPWNPALAEQWSAAAQQMIAAAHER